MVRPVSSSQTPHPASRPVTSQPTQDVGKPSHSVGHQAKAAIMGMKSAVEGQALPKNAQGKFASAIARGLDPATIMILQDVSAPVDDPAPVTDDPAAGDPIADDPIAGDPVVDDPVVDDPVVDDPVVDDPVAGDPVVDEPVGDVVLDEPGVLPVVDEPIVDPVADEPVAGAVTDEPVVELMPDEAVIELPDPDVEVLDTVLTDLLIDNEDSDTT